MSKHLRFLSLMSFILLSCSSCSLSTTAGSTTLYNVSFNLASAGNVLNPDIYHPDAGPIGFISYKSFFRSCSVNLDYDGQAVFKVILVDNTSFSKKGTYHAGPAGKGNTLVVSYSDGDVITYYWPNYYQFYATECFDLPGLGLTPVTILYHAAVIFQ